MTSSEKSDGGTPKPDTAAKLTEQLTGTPGFNKLRQMWDQASKSGVPLERETMILREVTSIVRPPTITSPTIESPPRSVPTEKPPLTTVTTTKTDQPKLTWQEKRRRQEQESLEREESSKKLTAELLVDLKSLTTMVGRSCALFRADGRSPWVMLDKHAGRFDPQPGAITRQAFFIEVFSTSKSPEDWFRNWIITHPKGKPCVSTGPKFDDAQGGSNANWFYGFSIPGGLTRIGPDSAALSLELGFTAKACQSDGVSLLTDTGSMAGASVIILEFAGEHIWLTGIPEQYIVGYAKSTQIEWLAQWRPFARGQLAEYRRLLSSSKYADLVSWPTLYSPGK